MREQWIRNKYVDRMFVKPLHSNEFGLDEIYVKKWSVQKVRRRRTQYNSKNHNDNKHIKIFDGILSTTIPSDDSSDDESTIDDECDSMF